MVGLARVLHVYVALDLLLGYLLELDAELFYLVLDLLEIPNLVVLFLLWFFGQNGLNLFIELVNNNSNLFLIQGFSILHQFDLNVQKIILEQKYPILEFISGIPPIFINMPILKYLIVSFLLLLELDNRL